MVYNLKLIEYPNGSTQLRYYSEPLQSKKPSDPYEEVERHNYIPEGYEENPFTGKLVRVSNSVETFDEIEKRIEDNRYRNANRTKQMVHTYARCGNWEWFITLTFNKEKVDRYNYDECSRKVRQWLHNQRRNAPDLQYLLVPEQHKDGAWHFHGLLARCGDMKFIDSGKKDKGQNIYNMIKYQYGFTTATKVKDIDRVSKYIGKYITKNICDLTPGRQRYFVSNNLPQPKVSTFFIPQDEDLNDMLEMLVSSMGKEIAHVSDTQANDCYTHVTYLELT